MRSLLLFILVFEINEAIIKIYDIKVTNGITVETAIEKNSHTNTTMQKVPRLQLFFLRYCQLEPRCVYETDI